MFKRNTLITKGVQEKVDVNLISWMWQKVQLVNNRQLDYLQIFELKNVGTKNDKMLKVTWKQEQPEHIETYYLRGFHCGVTKIWIICSGEETDYEYSTMLLPEEY